MRIAVADHPWWLLAWGDDRSGQLGKGSSTILATKPVSVDIRLTRVSSTAQNVAVLDRSRHAR